MNSSFLKDIVEALLPQYDVYKENIKELDEFEHMIISIQKVQSFRGKMDQYDLHKVRLLDEILETACTKLENVLRTNSDVSASLNEDFELWALQFEDEVRAIDQSIFPCRAPPPTASRYIPPVIQRTSKHLSSTLIRAMTRNTKYHDYLSLGKGQRHRYSKRILIIFLAWTLALIGMIVSIGLLTKDFIIAQVNLSVQVDRSPASPMKLPAITICSDLWNIPSFEDYPTDNYPGLPLFAVSMYSRGNRSIQLPKAHLMFPETLPGSSDSPVEPVVVSDGVMNCDLKGFNVERELNSLKAIGQGVSFNAIGNSKAGCLHCFRVGLKHKELLAPYHSDTSAAQFSPAVHVAMSKSRMFGYCQSYYIRRSTFVEQLFASELFLHARKLEEKGILDFNGQDYSVLKRRLSLDSVPTRADFYCNVYFFSGYFYPSLDNAHISYQYTGLPDVWTKSGKGPYYTGYTWEVNEPMQVGPNLETLTKDTYTFGGIRMYAEDPDGVNLSYPVSPHTEFTLLDRFSISTMITFKKMLVLDRVEYNVREKINEVIGYEDKLVDWYHLGFDFELFELERVYTYSTMTWSEYITDVFEFIGLFTGICIFTLIVAPANRAKED